MKNIQLDLVLLHTVYPLPFTLHIISVWLHKPVLVIVTGLALLCPHARCLSVVSRAVFVASGFDRCLLSLPMPRLHSLFRSPSRFVQHRFTISSWCCFCRGTLVSSLLFQWHRKTERLSRRSKRDCLLAGVFNSVSCRISNQVIVPEKILSIQN